MCMHICVCVHIKSCMHRGQSSTSGFSSDSYFSVLDNLLKPYAQVWGYPLEHRKLNCGHTHTTNNMKVQVSAQP